MNTAWPLGLIGLTVLWIATKYEDVQVVTASEMRGAEQAVLGYPRYRTSDLLRCELELLQTLQYWVPRTYFEMAFFELWKDVDPESVRLRSVGGLKRFTFTVWEMMILDHSLLWFHTEAHIAAALVLVLRTKLHIQPIWPIALQQQTQFTEEALRFCAAKLCPLIDRAFAALDPTPAPLESAEGPTMVSARHH